MNCQVLSQLTDLASLAFALARFGKVGREATNQKVGSSSPPARTTSPSSSISYAPPQLAGLLQGRDCHENVTDHVLDRLFHSLVRGALEQRHKQSLHNFQLLMPNPRPAREHKIVASGPGWPRWMPSALSLLRQRCRLEPSRCRRMGGRRFQTRRRTRCPHEPTARQPAPGRLPCARSHQVHKRHPAFWRHRRWLFAEFHPNGAIELIRDGIVDEKRIGLYGFSNGGAVAAQLLSKTERFKCAVIVAPASSIDWTSKFLLTSLDNSLAYIIGAVPWEDPDKYVALSVASLLSGETSAVIAQAS